jgi:hypothetical protein
MTSGALMSLVAYGAQDVYLTGNPQITHFKVVYRRHTNFALETISISMSGNCQFGSKPHVCITRNGDLISNVYLQVTLEAVKPSAGSKFAWVRRLGHALLKSVEVEIGGSRIDKQFGVWLNIWYDLAHHAGDGERGFFRMIGDVPELTNYNGTDKCEYTLYIPLQFWFNRHYGLSLPLIALQYHEVRLHFDIANASEVIVANGCFKERDLSKVRIKDCQVLVKYVFLDSEERRRFAQVGHEYLIEQVQYTEDSVSSDTRKYQLDFNHPTKELIWAMKNGNYSTGKAFPYYTDDWTNPCIFEEAAKKILSESLMLTDLGGAADGGCACEGHGVTVDGATATGQSVGVESVGYGALDAGVSSLATAGDNLGKLYKNQCACQPRSGGAAGCPDVNPNNSCAGASEAWQGFCPGASCQKTANCKITVINETAGNDDSQTGDDSNCGRKILWINTQSLVVDPTQVKCTSAGKAAGSVNPNSLTDKICATVKVDACCNIFICDVETTLTIRDLSFPVDCLLDNRNQEMVDDPCVNQCNFGTLIDGSGNPVAAARLQINGHEREEKFSGDYFNYVQPNQHHTNTPSDGINVYSFALYPELHQPSGTTNLSRIDNTQLCLWFADPTKGCDSGLPDLCFLNQQNKIWIFALSYNVLRICKIVLKSNQLQIIWIICRQSCKSSITLLTIIVIVVKC